MSSAAGADSGVIGLWSGTLSVQGVELRLVMHVSTDVGGKLAVTLDSIDQGAVGLVGANAILSGNAFSFEVPSVRGKFEGTLAADGKTISGTWSQGTPLPLVFARTTEEAAPKPVLPYPARPPIALGDLKAVLDQELAAVLKDGLLSPRTHGGLVIGVVKHGERRIYAYGTAREDSIFEIGSITKTFTGLMLAQMVVQKKVTLDEPVIDLLPQDFAGHPTGSQITLLDLATQHSGLPRMPDNFSPKNAANPYADYDSAKLSEFLRGNGLIKPSNPQFLYSNIGFGLLGFALANREGVPYETLLQTEVLGPLDLRDTTISLSPGLRARLIQGYDASFNPAVPWDFDAFAGAGAIRSTANDMLTYLDANMHPEKYTAGAIPGSPAATFAAAVALDHQPRGDVEGGAKIALAWLIDPRRHWLDHNGGTGAYGAFARFAPDQDWGVIVLYNRGGPFPRFVDNVGQNVSQLLAGEAAVRLDHLPAADSKELEQLNSRSGSN